MHIIVGCTLCIGVALLITVVLMLDRSDTALFIISTFYYPVHALNEYASKHYGFPGDYFVFLCIPMYLLYSEIVGAITGIIGGIIVYFIRTNKRQGNQSITKR